MEIVALALLLLLGSKGKADGKSLPGQTSSGADIMARAHTKRAADWVPIFMKAGQSRACAEAFARWAGIESSGNPLAVSPIGERGLFQMTKTTRKGIFDDKEWAALISPNTTPDEHARLALKEFVAMWKRAKASTSNPPTNAADIIWYAKMYHQRPADFKIEQFHGPAKLMAQDLAGRWKDDPKKSTYLKMANVIAFDTPNP